MNYQAGSSGSFLEVDVAELVLTVVSEHFRVRACIWRRRNTCMINIMVEVSVCWRRFGQYGYLLYDETSVGCSWIGVDEHRCWIMAFRSPNRLDCYSLSCSCVDYPMPLLFISPISLVWLVVDVSGVFGWIGQRDSANVAEFFVDEVVNIFCHIRWRIGSGFSVHRRMLNEKGSSIVSP